MYRGKSLLTTPIMSIWRLCAKTSSRLAFVRHLYLRVTVKTPHAWALQNVWDSLIWSWHSFSIHCLTITLSQSLVLDFCYPFLRDSLLIFPLTSFYPLYVYRDKATRDKLIFLSAITRILHHFFVSSPESTHLSPICAIDVATFRRREAQLRPKWPWTETVAPPASSACSISAPSSLVGGVTLEAVMVQLQCIDACLDTLNGELC